MLMAARRSFVQVGTMPAHAEAVIDPTLTYANVLDTLIANERFAATLKGVCVVDCSVQVSTSREGADRRVMDGPDTLATLFPGDAPLWIQVILPPPIAGGAVGGAGAGAAHGGAGAGAAGAEGETAPPFEQLANWLRGMLSAKVHTDESGSMYIELSGGAQWANMLTSKLYVRKCYVHLWEDVLKRCTVREELDATNAILIGTPGIGKSAFGLYAIFRAIQDGRIVIFNSLKGGRVMFKGGKAHELPSDDLNNLPELNNPETLYVCDGLLAIPHKRAFRLLISSPGVGETKWPEFSKERRTLLLILPVFFDDEMWALHKLGFRSLPRELVIELMRKWGNNPRNVLTLGTTSYWQDMLNTAVYSHETPAVMTALIRFPGLDAFKGKHHRHRLLQLVPKGALPGSTLSPASAGYYDFDHAELASPHVWELFAERMDASLRQEVYKFIHSSARVPTSAGFRGVLYEHAVVFPRMRAGGALLRAELLTATEEARAAHVTAVLASPASGLGLRLLPSHVFTSADELRVQLAKEMGDALFIPLSREFPAVDLVLRLGGQLLLANATVSQEHGIKVANEKFGALLRAIGLFEGAAVIPFLWLLPDEETFTGFKVQPLQGSGKPLTSTGSPRHLVGKRIVQYKVLLPVPATVADARAATAAAAEVAGAGISAAAGGAGEPRYLASGSAGAGGAPAAKRQLLGFDNAGSATEEADSKASAGAGGVVADRSAGATGPESSRSDD